MNLYEFIFAFSAVFGVSGFWMLWTKLIYKIGEESEEKAAITLK